MRRPRAPSSLSTQRLEPGLPSSDPISVCAGPSLMEGTGVQALLLGEKAHPAPRDLCRTPWARRKPCKTVHLEPMSFFLFSHRYPKASHGPQLRSPRVFVWVGEVHLDPTKSKGPPPFWRGIGGALAAKPSWRGLP